MTSTDITTATVSARLRALADVLDAHPGLPDPYISASGSGSGKVEAHWYLHIHELNEDLPGQKTAAAAIVRTFGGTWDKADRTYDNGFEFTQTRDGIELQVVVNREAVCERVVTGTHEVVVVAAKPAQPAMDALPEHVQVVEDVTWRCSSLLASDVEPVAS